MIAIEVEDPSWREALPEIETLTERAAQAALQEAQGDVVVLLADDEAVRALNAEFRGKDAATNVLSFPAPESASPHLGDIALAFGVCQREAQAQGKTLSDHLSHLVVHGVLHLLGRDHQDDEEAEAMEGEERRVLASLGVADPYRAILADG